MSLSAPTKNIQGQSERTRNKYKSKRQKINAAIKQSKLKRINNRKKRTKKKHEREQKNIIYLSQRMAEAFGKDAIESIARMTGFLTRKAKMIPLAFLITVAFGTFGKAGKLSTLAGYMSQWFGIQVTPQALSNRLKQASTVRFLKKMFQMALDFQLQQGFNNRYAELFGGFKGVFLEDSTRFELSETVAGAFKGNGGGASKAAMKINVCYDITRHVASWVDVVSAAVSDQTLGKKIVKVMKANELYIRDLGYFDLTIIAMMIKKGVYFLSRLQKGVHIYLEATDTIPSSVD